MIHGVPEHLYVHVPFCDGRCRYCAFYSIPAVSGYADYAPLPVRELERRGSGPYAPVTVYIGGGTPSCDPRCLDVLLSSLNRRIDLTRLAEWTVEVSPHQVTDDLAGILVRNAVSRVSLGVQSFNDRVLTEMGRRHHASDTAEALRTLRAAGIRALSLDLIADWPTESLPSFRAGLEQALELGTAHLSLYSLSVEAGAPIAKSGTFATLDGDAALDRISLAEQVLAAEGVGRYEISNYARPGAECLHNLAVWRGMDFLGLGPSASSRLGRIRRGNDPDLHRYLRAVTAGKSPPGREETLSAEEDLTERFTTGLRLAEGVNPTEFRARYPDPQAAFRLDQWERQLETMRGFGLVDRREETWRLTPRGREVADGVMRELVT